MFRSFVDTLPGLLPASFRGVPFFVLDASSEAGRRTAETLFPGRDDAHFDDLGKHQGIHQLTAIMVGDDYIARGKALMSACERPGAGTLIHPWLGRMRVILAEPASVQFSSSELRVARVALAVKQLDQNAGSQTGGNLAATGSLVAIAAMGVTSAVNELVAGALTGSPSTAAQLGAAGTQADAIDTEWGAAIEAEAPENAGATTLGRARLTGAPEAGSGEALATAFSGALTSISDGLVDAASVKPSPAIGGR